MYYLQTVHSENIHTYRYVRVCVCVCVQHDDIKLTKVVDIQ